MGSRSTLWNEEMEAVSRERMEHLQWSRLKDRLTYLNERSPFYKKRFDDAAVAVSTIQNLDEFRRQIPFTTKEDLQTNRVETGDPYGGVLCVNPEEVLQLVRTGGTTGTPTIYGLTEGDLRLMGELCARLWYQLGARKGDTVAIATMGCWNSFAIALVEGLRTGGINRYHYSMPVPGEDVFPIEILPKWLRVQGIYLSARPLWQVTKKYGTRLKELLPHLEYVLVAGQRVTSSFRAGIEQTWGGRLFEAYTMTDVCLPAANCQKQTDAFHFPEDAFLVEIVDPDTGEDKTGTGSVGEVVVTSLAFEGTPLLRFRTGDMGYTTSGKCPCGRTGMRLGISEREAHAIHIGRHKVFSSEVEDILYGIPQFFMKQYHLVRQTSHPQESLLLRIERPSDTAMEESLRGELVAKIGDRLGVPAQIEFVSEGDEKFVTLYKFLRVVDE